MKGKLILLAMVFSIMFLPISFALTHITGCMDLNQQGETYVLDNDITFSYGNCLMIHAPYITLDCQGHTIYGTDSADTSIGIWSDHATVKNCRLIGGKFGIALGSNSQYLTVTDIYCKDLTDTCVHGHDGGIYHADIENIEEEQTVNRAWTIYSGQTGMFDSVIKNVKVRTDSQLYNVIGLFNSKNVEISNVDSYGYSTVVYTSNSSDIVVRNVKASNGKYSLLVFYASDNIKVEDSILRTTNSSGIVLAFTNNSIIVSNIIEDCNRSAIRLYASRDNHIVNNLLNCTQDVMFSVETYQNYWNTTLQEATNILGGNIVGGNYWGSPDGTGYSDTCEDSDKNGICDSPYVINEMNIDYLPLSKFASQMPTGYFVWGNMTNILFVIIAIALLYFVFRKK